MKKLLVTSDFCKGSKQLINANKLKEVNSLRTVLILLANGQPIPKKYHDHQLTGKEYRELHISGDVLLLYRNEVDSDTLVVSLKLTNITDHKNLNRDASRNDYTYNEVSTQDLHDITSSVKLDKSAEVFLTDLLESVADYASGELSEGYILFDDYQLIDSELHCIYDYYLDDTTIDSIDFIIDLDKYDVNQLHKYLDSFVAKVAASFREE